MGFMEFHNALRILWNIDYPEFRDAVLNAGDPEVDTAWQRFRDSPHDWFVRAPDAQAQAIFAIVEERNARYRS